MPEISAEDLDLNALKQRHQKRQEKKKKTQKTRNNLSGYVIHP